MTPIWLLILILVPFIGSLLFVVLPKRSLRLPRQLAMAITTVCLVLLGVLTSHWSAESPLIFTQSWMPAIGLEFSLWLDGPALFYAWLVLGIGLLVFYYAGHYMKPDDSPWRFYGMMVLFMGSMVGVVTSRNTILMFLFWEMTSLSSFLLIGHWHEKGTARAGALRALIVTGGGGLSLLLGLATISWIMHASGSPDALSWDALWANREIIVAHPAAPVALLFLLVGAFTKSAQFPFHFWLPGAMEAPTPVSAYLHAATMVKAGIYLLGRIYPIFGNEMLWLAIVPLVGIVTMFIGGFMAVISRDLKQLLAFSTVSQLGLLTAYYGFGYGRIGSPEEPLALDLLLVASHAFFKGALFMLVGVIDHGAHTRDWKRLGGLWRVMPWTTALTIIGCLSMAGVPLTLGFVAKELFLHAGFHVETHGVLIWRALPILAVVASIFTVAYCMRIAISPFFGKPRDPSIHPHEGNVGILLAPAILIGLCVIGGFFVPAIEHPLAHLVNSEFYGTHSHFTVAFYRHLDVIFASSMFLFFVGGPAAFFGAGGIEQLYEKKHSPMPFTRFYEYIFLDKLPAFASWVALTIQSHSLRRNVMMTLAVFAGLMLVPLTGGLKESPMTLGGPVDLLAIGVTVLTAFCLVIMLLVRRPMTRLMALSVVGVMVALYFLSYRAPDLILTQILVEVANLFMFLLLLSKIPLEVPKRDTPVGVSISTIIAVCVGLVFGVLNFMAATSPDRAVPILEGNPTVAEYYEANSKYPAVPGEHSGGGNNIVNVILVDFRGIDTMGEITVLGIAAIGVICLLTFRKKEHYNLPHTHEAPPTGMDDEVSIEISGRLASEQVDSSFMRKPIIEDASLILKVCALPTLFLIGSISAILFFAGHNAPGGGFIAGLLTAVACTPYFLYTSKNEDPYGKRDPSKLIPFGLFFAVGTGVVAVLLGGTFLQSAFTYIPIPLFGKVGLASAMAFDFGVYLMVVGVTLTIIRMFGRSGT